MKKDNVLLYDGGFIDYEKWNAPVVIDILGVDMQNPVQVTILGGYSVGTASVQRDATISENQVTLLFADVDITKMDEFDQNMVANLKFACDIVVQDGGYVQPNTSFDVNDRTLTAGKNGAWLITKSKLQSVTATSNDKPAWKIDNDYEANGTDVNDTKQPTGAKKMDMETLNQCSQVLQKANKTPEDTKIYTSSENPFHDDMNNTQQKIIEVCERIKNLLLEKNRKYGNSALNPVRVFSKADTVEQIKVRMDDKLSRIRNEQGDEDEDVYMDLAGYLVLMLIAKEEQKKTKGETDK